ncbi:ComEA family DNA-binding protein [Micromonospora robiginosa]|uniref:ComEA family DNA-binding protein n=1 Tax=Micromonospora robiginosa TaxID=2749844 RepID=A0A7L6B692_9ACTN|nr:ComEA family DNA-binding protein [Micromonospora ferruginea]QLQ37355.1 ComEA family DNA-binding protein [Micromonospora ferruginea]
MSDDEETTVRRRLTRLFAPAPGEAADAAVGIAPHAVRAAAPEPAYPFVELRRSGPRRDHPEPDQAPVPLFGASLVSDADGPAESPDPEPGRGLASRLPGPGAFDPGRRGVRALAAVAALVVLVAAVWAWRSRPTAEPVRPIAPAGEASAGEASAGEATPVAGGAAAPAGSSGQVVVAVAGKVRRPGLVRLPAGARLADAVAAAGGALPGVDVALLNPARKVTDGELILVGVTAPPGQPAPGGGAPGPAAGGGAAPAGPVNLNTATLAQLDGLPGVGPVLAQRILDHREQHGGFRSVSDLRQVEGIGDARYEQLKELVTV